jgi:hypothetical protein
MQKYISSYDLSDMLIDEVMYAYSRKFHLKKNFMRMMQMVFRRDTKISHLFSNLQF